MDTEAYNHKTGSEEHRDAQPNILNVFFHGLFVFIDRPSGIDVLLPEVPDH